MIYALRATNNGRALVQSPDIDTNVPFCRSLLLIAVVSQRKTWVEWTSIDGILRDMLNDLKQNQPETLEVKQLERYIESPSKKINDVLKLESQLLIQAARYRSSTGNFVRERPVGMVFRSSK